MKQEYGASQHPMFFLSPSYWGFLIGRSGQRTAKPREEREVQPSPFKLTTFVRSVLRQGRPDENGTRQSYQVPQVEQPPDASTYPPRVKIKEVKKCYPNGTFAVKGLDLTM